MASRVETGCNTCKRCTNSKAAEAGRRHGRAWANAFTFGGVAMVQAFTPDCRSCGHKLSLHDRGNGQQGNSYAALVSVQAPPARPVYRPAPPQVPAGWYPDPDGQPCQRWWDGQQWTGSTAPR